MYRISPGKFNISKKYLLPFLWLISVIFLVQVSGHQAKADYNPVSEIRSSKELVAKTNSPVAQIAKQPSIDMVNLAAQPRAIPILMYHKTPDDFEAQLAALQAKGYTTISMAMLADYFDGLEELPLKPAVITFDDGFGDQMQAVEMLRAHNMKATFYMIIGGANSQGCIGITRSNLSCGDSYLNWSQVREIASSDLIEIGAHTINHADLPSLTREEQLAEIAGSKKVLEDELRKPISTLAYPYGKFNATTIELASQAGFRTAVTTVAGELQSSANRLTLMRVRNALLLP